MIIIHQFDYHHDVDRDHNKFHGMVIDAFHERATTFTNNVVDESNLDAKDFMI